MVNNVDKLKTTIDQYVEVVNGTAKGDLDDLQDNIMSITKNMYKKNFKKGVKIDRYRPGVVATQAHPELKSSLLKPAPLFYELVKAAKE